MDPPLRVREDWWVFEDLLRFKGGLVGFRKTLKVKGGLVFFRRFKELLLFFSNVNKVLVGFRKTSLALREVFRKPFLSPIS